MSRSNYTDDCENLELWRRTVRNALQGKRGQAFLRDLLTALDAMPQKRLISHDLIADGEVCALGSVGVHRGLNMSEIDADEPWEVAGAFGIAPAMAQEIVYMNDEYPTAAETPEQRWVRMRAWVVKQLGPDNGN